MKGKGESGTESLGRRNVSKVNIVCQFPLPTIDLVNVCQEYAKTILSEAILPKSNYLILVAQWLIFDRSSIIFVT